MRLTSGTRTKAWLPGSGMEMRNVQTCWLVGCSFESLPCHCRARLDSAASPCPKETSTNTSVINAVCEHTIVRPQLHVHQTIARKGCENATGHASIMNTQRHSHIVAELDLFEPRPSQCSNRAHRIHDAPTPCIPLKLIDHHTTDRMSMQLNRGDKPWRELRGDWTMFYR
jgi:hypothetical protein